MATSEQIDYICTVVPVKEFGQDRPWEVQFVSTFWTCLDGRKGRRIVIVKTDPKDFTFTHEDVIENLKNLETFLRTTDDEDEYSATASTLNRQVLTLPLKDMELDFKRKVYDEVLNGSESGWDVTVAAADDFTYQFLIDQDLPEVVKVTNPLPPKSFLLTTGLASFIGDRQTK